MSHVKIVYDADKGILVPEDGSSEGSSSPKKLCYIDDSRTSAYVTGKILNHYGYEVEHFNSAEVALDSILLQDYDLILTDLYVTDEGGVNGDDLVHLLRNSGHPQKSVLPIIVVTGTDDSEVHTQVLAAGASIIIIKPLDGKILDDVIQQLLTTGEVPEKIIFPADYQPASELKPATADDTKKPGQEQAIDPNVALSTEDTLKALKALGAQPVQQTHDDLFSFIDQESQPTPSEEIEKDLPGLPLESSKQADTTENHDDVPVLTTAIARKRGDSKRKQIDKFPDIDVAAQEYQSVEPAPVQEKRTPEVASDVKITPPNFEIDSIADISGEESKEENTRSIESITNTKKEPETEAPAAEIPGAFNQVQDSISSVSLEAEQKEVPRNDLLDLLDKLEVNSNDVESGSDVQHTKQSTSKQRKWFVGRVSMMSVVVMSALIALGAGLFLNHSTEIELLDTTMGDIHDAIAVPGTVVSHKTSNVTSYFPGQIVRVLVKEGDTVSKNDILAELDGRETKSAVKRARAELMSIKEEVAATGKTLERLQKALDVGAVPRQMVEDAEATWKSVSARQGVAEEELASARLMKERLKIRAPFQGIVTTISAQSGQWLSPPAPLLRLVNLTKREIELKVDAVDAGRLKIGQNVLVSLAGAEQRQWQEKVLRIASTTNSRGSSNTISVYVSMGKKARSLIIGQQVNAEIRLASSQGVVKVPFSALHTVDNKTSVAIVLNGKIHFIPVTTGLEDVSHIEIREGLEVGQKVVKLEGKKFAEGDAVHIAESK